MNGNPIQMIMQMMATYLQVVATVGRFNKWRIYFQISSDYETSWTFNSKRFWWRH